MGAVVVVLIVLVAGFLLWTLFQGKTTPDAPSINPPNPGDIVSGADDAARSGSDFILGLPQEVWTFVVPLAIVVIVVFKVLKNPTLRLTIIVLSAVALGYWVATN